MGTREDAVDKKHANCTMAARTRELRETTGDISLPRRIITNVGSRCFLLGLHTEVWWTVMVVLLMYANL